MGEGKERGKTALKSGSSPPLPPSFLTMDRGEKGEKKGSKKGKNSNEKQGGKKSWKVARFKIRTFTPINAVTPFLKEGQGKKGRKGGEEENVFKEKKGIKDPPNRLNSKPLVRFFKSGREERGGKKKREKERNKTERKRERGWL